MRHRPVAPLAAITALLLGCGEPVEPRAPEISPSAAPTGPTVPVPSVTATEAPPPKGVIPVLAPLVTDARPACDIAADLRKEADSLHAKGRSYKALRLIASADAQCPKTAPGSGATKVSALSALGRDAEAQALAKEILAATPPDPAAVTAARAVTAKTPQASPPAADTLLTQALTAHKSGDSDARSKLDRAVVRFEQDTSDVPRPFLDTGARSALAVSRDGATAVFASGAAAVLYDAKDLRPRRVFEAPKKRFDAAAISPDNKQIALADDAGYVTLWSAATGKQVKRFSWANEDPNALLFSVDGKRLIVGGSASFDTTVRIWSLETGDSADSIEISRGGGATAIAQSRDGKTLVVGTGYGTIETWSLSPKKKLATLTKKDSYSAGITSLAFSPKGDKIAALTQGAQLSVYDVKTSKALFTSELQRTFDDTGITFSADGSRVFAGATEGFSPTLREWDATTGAELQNKPVGVTPTLFSEDGKTAIGADRTHAGVLDLTTSTVKSIPEIDHGLSTLELGPPRTLAFVLDGEKNVRVVTPTMSRIFENEDAHGPLAISLDGRFVSRGSWRDLRVFDVEKGGLVGGYPAPPESNPTAYFGPQGSGMRLVYGPYNGTKIFTAAPGDRAWKEVFSFDQKGTDQILLSEYGPSIAAREERRVFLIHPTTGETRTVDDDPKDRPDTFTLSPDGRALFIVRNQRIARFDAETGKVTHAWTPVGCWASRVASSFDGSRIALQCSDRLQIFTFPKDTDAPAVTALDPGRVHYGSFAIAPHGDLVLTAGDDGRIRIWDWKGTLRAEIVAFAGTDSFLAFTPSGRAYLSGQDRAKLDDRLYCRIGPVIVPFVACEDALGDDSVLRDAFAPGPP